MRHNWYSRPIGSVRTGRASAARLAAAPRSRSVTIDAWRKVSDWPLAFCVVVFLVVYAWDVLAEPTGLRLEIADRTLWVIWLLFAIDFAVRFWLAERRGYWFATHLHEFAAVALPMLRPLRALRLVSLVGTLHQTVGGSLHGRVVIYAVGSTVLLVFVASLAMLDTERHAAGSTITTFLNALWWAREIVTRSVTVMTFLALGRGASAAALLVAGMALLGIVTATLASWLVEQVSKQDEATQAVTRDHIDRLTQEIAQLRQEVLALPELPTK